MGNKLIVTGMVILIALGIIGVFNIDFDSKKCSYSQYNPSNVSGGKYFFGKCFVPYYETYESTEKCGFLSISCRTVEPYVKMNSGALCFKLKTGELCDSWFLGKINYSSIQNHPATSNTDSWSTNYTD